MARAEKNPFDLEGRDGGPERAHRARVWTEEEQAERLGGYLEIPPEFWSQIRYGTHVRYFTKTDGYRPGGFVVKNPLDSEAAAGGAEKRFMKLQNGFNDKARGYQQWVVSYADVEKMFMKPDASALVVMQSLEIAVKGLNDNIRKLADHSKKLEARVGALERAAR